MTTPTNPTVPPSRRGMLLLLVLTILSLFIVVGAVGILLALRARETARAFAAASAGQSASGTLARAQLDEALLKLIRGPSRPAPASDVTESLLEDKYGTTDRCTVTALTTTGSAVMRATVTGLDLTNPMNVAGRILTFVPASNDPTGPSSYRILRANAATNMLLLANIKPQSPTPLPSVFPCEAVINGREFAGTQPVDKNEAHDAFDDQNRFLTRPLLQNALVSSVTQPAFGDAGTPCTVDNDGDGVADGVWLSDVLPPQRSPDSGQLTFEVSYLVLDLDGRINLNAHGSSFRRPDAQRVGMGYGPADVDAARLLPDRWGLIMQGGTVLATATVSSANQWRPAPPIERQQAGRYGFGPGTAQPGGSAITGTSPLHSDFWISGTTAGNRANSPSDLKARVRVVTAGSPPTLTFERPAPAWAFPDTDDVLGPATAAHPYRMRLDEDAPRDAGRAGVGTSSDAVFSPGELERVLRQFDADAAVLAPRLAAMLDNRAQALRMVVTTDSWDTPAIAGQAWNKVRTSLTGGDAYAVHSPEVVAGLRFNVNRPLVLVTASTATVASSTTSFRQEYFRQLYTLVRSLTDTEVPPAAAAQWAANVIEFRDPDSIMTWYPYDTNPLDGMWTTGTGVWGVERPELVITDAQADGNQARVKLYRPWKAQLEAGAATPVATERIDASLGDAVANTLDVTRKSGADPIWRIADTANPTVTGTGLDTLLSSATAVAVNSEAGQVTLAGSAPPTVVVLKRLADPSRARNTDSSSSAYNDYVSVHRVSLPVASRTVSRWLHWPNRDLISHGELLAVPGGDPGELPEAAFVDAPATRSLARQVPDILDATIVPSRFVGANVSVANGATHLAGTGFENFQHGQFSRWREAGRVNVNTILDDSVWNILADAEDANPFSPGSAGYPAKGSQGLLLAAAVEGINADSANTGFRYRTPIRLASTATIRSHVFAVWITLRITDSSPTAGSPQVARLFAIVDRSVPVGYASGRTLNAHETIRLRRFLP